MLFKNLFRCCITLNILLLFSNNAVALPDIRSILEEEGVPKEVVNAALETDTIGEATKLFFTSRDYSLTYDAISANLWNSSYFTKHPLGKKEGRRIFNERVTTLREAAIWFDKNPEASWEEVAEAGFEKLIPIKATYERSKRVRSAIAEFTPLALNLESKIEDEGIFTRLDEEKLKSSLYEKITEADLKALIEAFQHKYDSITQSIYYLGFLMHVAPQAITDGQIADVANALKNEVPRTISIVKRVAKEEFNTYFIDEATFIKERFEPEAEDAWEKGKDDGEYLKKRITNSNNQKEFNSLVVNGARNLVGAPGHLAETLIYGLAGGILSMADNFIYHQFKDASVTTGNPNGNTFPLSTWWHTSVTNNLRPIFERYNPGGSVLGNDETFANMSPFEMGWQINPTIKFVIEPIAPIGKPISKIIELPRRLYHAFVQSLGSMSEEAYNKALENGDWDIYWGDKLCQLGVTLLSFGTIGKLKYSSKFLAAAARLAPEAKTISALNRLRGIEQFKAMLPAAYTSAAIGGFVSAGQEVWQSGEPGDNFNFRRFADNFTLQFSGSVAFMSGLSVAGAGVGFVGGNGAGALFLQRVLMQGTDVADGVSDFEETIKGLLRNSKNDQQYIGTLLVLVGNFVDTGDVSIPLSNLIENISQGSTGTFTPEDLMFVTNAAAIMGKERFRNLKKDQIEALVYSRRAEGEGVKEAILRYVGLTSEEVALLFSDNQQTQQEKLAQKLSREDRETLALAEAALPEEKGEIFLKSEYAWQEVLRIHHEIGALQANGTYFKTGDDGREYDAGLGAKLAALKELFQKPVEAGGLGMDAQTAREYANKFIYEFIVGKNRKSKSSDSNPNLWQRFIHLVWGAPWPTKVNWGIPSDPIAMQTLPFNGMDVLRIESIGHVGLGEKIIPEAASAEEVEVLLREISLINKRIQEGFVASLSSEESSGLFMSIPFLDSKSVEKRLVGRLKRLEARYGDKIKARKTLDSFLSDDGNHSFYSKLKSRIQRIYDLDFSFRSVSLLEQEHKANILEEFKRLEFYLSLQDADRGEVTSEIEFLIVREIFGDKLLNYYVTKAQMTGYLLWVEINDLIYQLNENGWQRASVSARDISKMGERLHKVDPLAFTKLVVARLTTPFERSNGAAPGEEPWAETVNLAQVRYTRLVRVAGLLKKMPLTSITQINSYLARQCINILEVLYNIHRKQVRGEAPELRGVEASFDFEGPRVEDVLSIDKLTIMLAINSGKAQEIMDELIELNGKLHPLDKLMRARQLLRHFSKFEADLENLGEIDSGVGNDENTTAEKYHENDEGIDEHEHIGKASKHNAKEEPEEEIEDRDLNEILNANSDEINNAIGWIEAVYNSMKSGLPIELFTERYNIPQPQHPIGKIDASFIERTLLGEAIFSEAYGFEGKHTTKVLSELFVLQNDLSNGVSLNRAKEIIVKLFKPAARIIKEDGGALHIAKPGEGITPTQPAREVPEKLKQGEIKPYHEKFAKKVDIDSLQLPPDSKFYNHELGSSGFYYWFKDILKLIGFKKDDTKIFRFRRGINTEEIHLTIDSRERNNKDERKAPHKARIIVTIEYWEDGKPHRKEIRDYPIRDIAQAYLVIAEVFQLTRTGVDAFVSQGLRASAKPTYDKDKKWDDLDAYLPELRLERTKEFSPLLVAQLDFTEAIGLQFDAATIASGAIQSKDEFGHTALYEIKTSAGNILTLNVNTIWQPNSEPRFEITSRLTNSQNNETQEKHVQGTLKELSSELEGLKSIINESPQNGDSGNVRESPNQPRAPTGPTDGAVGDDSTEVGGVETPKTATPTPPDRTETPGVYGETSASHAVSDSAGVQALGLSVVENRGEDIITKAEVRGVSYELRSNGENNELFIKGIETRDGSVWELSDVTNPIQVVTNGRDVVAIGKDGEIYKFNSSTNKFELIDIVVLPDDVSSTTIEVVITQDYLFVFEKKGNLAVLVLSNNRKWNVSSGDFISTVKDVPSADNSATNLNGQCRETNATSLKKFINFIHETAIHEVGHAVANGLLSKNFPTVELTLIPDDKNGARHKSSVKKRVALLTVQDLFAQIVVALSGYHAQLKILGEERGGYFVRASIGDLLGAGYMAKGLILIQRRSDFRRGLIPTTRIGEQELGAEGKRVVALADEVAKTIVNNNQDKIREIAEYLFAHGEMSGEELKQFLDVKERDKISLSELLPVNGDTLARKIAYSKAAAPEYMITSHIRDLFGDVRDFLFRTEDEVEDNPSVVGTRSGFIEFNSSFPAGGTDYIEWIGDDSNFAEQGEEEDIAALGGEPSDTPATLDHKIGEMLDWLLRPENVGEIGKLVELLVDQNRTENPGALSRAYGLLGQLLQRAVRGEGDYGHIDGGLMSRISQARSKFRDKALNGKAKKGYAQGANYLTVIFAYFLDVMDIDTDETRNALIDEILQPSNPDSGWVIRSLHFQKGHRGNLGPSDEGNDPILDIARGLLDRVLSRITKPKYSDTLDMLLEMSIYIMAHHHDHRALKQFVLGTFIPGLLGKAKEEGASDATVEKVHGVLWRMAFWDDIILNSSLPAVVRTQAELGMLEIEEEVIKTRDGLIDLYVHILLSRMKKQGEGDQNITAEQVLRLLESGKVSPSIEYRALDKLFLSASGGRGERLGALLRRHPLCKAGIINSFDDMPRLPPAELMPSYGVEGVRRIRAKIGLVAAMNGLWDAAKIGLGNEKFNGLAKEGLMSIINSGPQSGRGHTDVE